MSAINSLKSGVIFGLIGIFVRFFFGLGLALFVWFQLGGLTCIQHLMLRIILILNGYTPPLHYARFLNYCTEPLLLQKVGGRYRFMHRLLQEHFAAMPLEK
jgi:hypothetical protein